MEIILSIDSKNNGEPPVALVKTWLHLFLSSEDDEVKTRGKEMLLSAFGDMKAVSLYVAEHQIKIKQ
ncbi:MAG: hypothetical protein ACRBCS_15800 [Cellvibrionaceae bacterium]